jgi:hypothetical protein
VSRRREGEAPLEAVQSSWTPPPKGECDEETVTVSVDTQNIITMRRVEWNGQLVEYAVTHSRKDSEGNWVEVSSIDTMHHGYVHRHYGPDHSVQPTYLRAIRSQEDVQQSFEESYDAIYDSYLNEVSEGS